MGYNWYTRPQEHSITTSNQYTRGISYTNTPHTDSITRAGRAGRDADSVQLIGEHTDPARDSRGRSG